MVRNRPSLFLFLFALSLFVFISNARAAELAAPGTRERKFQRGLINTAFAPVEISYALSEPLAKGETLPPAWFGNGIFRGTYFAILRAFSGVWDIVTAPFPRPSEYKPLLRHHEFALKHLDLMKDVS